MKKTILTLTILATFAIASFSQTLNKNSLCKKWYLEKYEIFWIDYEPEANEKNDYILLKSDMTYISVDEGKKASGKWSFNSTKKYFTLYNKKGKGLKFFVDDLETNKMVLVVDIEELKDVDIHYKTKKK